MAARIIPFQQGMRRFSPVAASTSHIGSHVAVAPRTSGLRVLPVAALPCSQQQALRIVHEVQQEQQRQPNVPSATGPIGPQRSQDFWDTLPLPQSRRDTPFSVARRLMHMLFEPAHSA